MVAKLLQNRYGYNQKDYTINYQNRQILKKYLKKHISRKI